MQCAFVILLFFLSSSSCLTISSPYSSHHFPFCYSSFPLSFALLFSVPDVFTKHRLVLNFMRCIRLWIQKKKLMRISQMNQRWSKNSAQSRPPCAYQGFFAHFLWLFAFLLGLRLSRGNNSYYIWLSVVLFSSVYPLSLMIPYLYYSPILYSTLPLLTLLYSTLL